MPTLTLLLNGWVLTQLNAAFRGHIKMSILAMKKGHNEGLSGSLSLAHTNLLTGKLTSKAFINFDP